MSARDDYPVHQHYTDTHEARWRAMCDEIDTPPDRGGGTMSEERRAAVQATPSMDKPSGTIAWWEHEAAWLVYAARYGYNQSSDCIHERSGFDYYELVDQLGHEPTTWQPRRAAAPTGGEE